METNVLGVMSCLKFCNNKNLLKSASLVEKLFQSVDKYSLTTTSAIQKSFSSGRDDRLQSRFLNFLENSKETEEKERIGSVGVHQSNFRTTALSTSVQNDFSSQTLKKVSLEYKALIASIKILARQKQKSAEICLSFIDDSCCKILCNLSCSDILRLLHLLTRARPEDIAFSKFYKHSLRLLRKFLENRKLNKQESLQLLFFESLKKKQAHTQIKHTIKCLLPIDALSPMEQCIVAHAAFKCRVKLKNAKWLEDVIEANAERLVKDPAILVTFCKALRLSGLSYNCWLINLSEAIFNNNQRFTIKCAAHTLSLYAEAKLNRSEVLCRLLDDSSKGLAEGGAEEGEFAGTTEKDLDRLLWASSILNYKLRSQDVMEISSFVGRRYKKLSKKPSIFANTLLSLWMLNCRLEELVDKCLAENVFLPIVQEKELWKPVARLRLLLSCVTIEAPEIKLPDEIARSRKVGMKVQGSVRKLRKIIDELTERMELERITIGCPVDGMYIPGVSFGLKTSEMSFHIDLLDERTCFKGTNLPHGLMNLKLRLLSKIGFHSVLITGVQLNDAEDVSSSIERCIKKLS